MKAIGIILAGVAALALSACEGDHADATRIIEDAGYADVHIDADQNVWSSGCGKGDSYYVLFHAKGVTGRPVAGVVCSGNFKGGTIRLF